MRHRATAVAPGFGGNSADAGVMTTFVRDRYARAKVPDVICALGRMQMRRRSAMVS